jgi:nicotinamide riboside transporter PnuC
MTSEPKTSRYFEWTHAIVTSIGVAVLFFGARAFYRRGHFGFVDALYCLLMLIPAAAYLLVTSYVLQHARLVVVIPLFLAVVLVRGYPAFAVALGLALIGVIVDGALRNWKDAREADGR